MLGRFSIMLSKQFRVCKAAFSEWPVCIGLVQHYYCWQEAGAHIVSTYVFIPRVRSNLRFWTLASLHPHSCRATWHSHWYQSNVQQCMNVTRNCTCLLIWFQEFTLLQFQLFNFKYCTQNFNLIYIFPEIATSFICIFLFVEQFSCEIASGTPILTHNLKLACILNLSLLIHIQCCIKHPFSCWINDNTPCSVWSPLLPL